MIPPAPLSHDASRVAAALDLSSVGIALFDSDDRLVMCNRLYRVFCEPIADLLEPGATFASLVRASVERGFAPAPAGDRDGAVVLRLAQHYALDEPVELRRGERILLTRENRTPDGGTIQIVVDVTAPRAHEAQARRAEKLDALATFASGFAHDINNVLAMIRGYAELAGASLATDDKAVSHLARIVTNVDRAAGLTRALQGFSRHRPAEAVPLDLAALVLDLRARIAPLLPTTVRLDVSAPPTLFVRGDSDDLRHAIVQMAINARDAMAQGGILRIAVDELPASDATPAQARLTIADTGIGMDAATRTRIFEPFFTTKPTGGGAGLGLAMAYGAITRAGGTIAVESQPGIGTVFRIDLPRVEGVAAIEAMPASAANADTIPRRILLAEDEPELRELLRRALEEAGHTVIAAANGAEALALYETNAIDLLVTDIAMPEMDGLRLATDLTSRHPELRVIYMTGDPGRIGVGAADLPRNAIVLWKPFAPSRLAEVIAQAA